MESKDHTASLKGRASRASSVAIAVVLGLAIAWVYWPTVRQMATIWQEDPRYSHGYLVPAFALYLLLRRGGRESTRGGGHLWGLVLLGAGLGLRLAGARVTFAWAEGISLLPTLAGYACLVGGKPALRRAWPSIAFLAFMIPLPYQVEVALGEPLQRLATKVSTYAMQTLGLPALAEGNVIHLNETDIGVVEACSGLSMLFTFFAMATGAAIVINRPWLDRVIVVLSAVPIALLVNMIRITTTGVLHATVGGPIADKVYHDLAGWLMMPMAIGLLWLEVALLGLLLVEVPYESAGFQMRGVSDGRRDAGESKRPQSVGPEPGDATAALARRLLKKP
ncbi:MAG: exosortase/archaeosortase family protein [Isosphaeraceae bacterium]